MKTDPKITAARAFVRSLNILLKFARLYGFDHVRTNTQFETTWSELRAALSTDGVGLLLGATGSQLLLDGVPLEAKPAERSFAQLLSAAGLASIHFSPNLTQSDLGCFVRAFPCGGARPSALAEQLKAALTGVTAIRLNEIRFVAEDAGLADAKVAATLTAKALGADAEQFKQWLNDPQKLLQLIAAAQGTQSTGGGPGGSASGPLSGQPGAGAGIAAHGKAVSTAAVEAGAAAPRAGSGGGWGPVGGIGFSPQEVDILNILGLLTHLGEVGNQPSGLSGAGQLQKHLGELPPTAQDSLRQALAALAAKAPAEMPGQPVLVRLAEHLAIRFALERYESGEVRVNAVRQMLDRMGQQIDGLRKILGTHEEKLAKAGILVESHADALDRQFWAAVPESGKRAVLTSPEAWCIPPRNVRHYVEELLGRKDRGLAEDILLNYASCITNLDAEARRKTAIGLAELAELYARGEGRALMVAIRQAGLQLSVERDTELQSLVSAAFVHLTQEAGTLRSYAALQQALGSLESVENQRPAFAQSLRPRIGVEDRLPEFIEESLRAAHIPNGLADLMRLMPRPAAGQLTIRFNRCGQRKDCDRLVELTQTLGPEGFAYLRETLRFGPPAEAAETVGLLSRLDPDAVEQWLPTRVREWQRSAHDRVVRLLASGGAPERGRLLLAVFEALDPLIRSLALDESGMTGDASIAAQLLPLADGVLPEGSSEYLRLKAVEALGRIRANAAPTVLRRIAETKQMFRWVHPAELRLVAVQSMEKLDPQWTQEFLPRAGFDPIDFSLSPLDPVADAVWLRRRRYRRIRMRQPLTATATTQRECWRVEVKALSLSGGMGGFEKHLAPGTLVAIKLGTGLRTIRAQALMRDARAHGQGFEFVAMELDDRSKLRRLLASQLNPSATVDQIAVG